MKPKAKQSVVLLADGQRIELAAAGAEPKWQMLFPLGATKYRADFPREGITFSGVVLKTMVSNWEAEGKPERQVNYFHRGSTSARDTTPKEEKVASGWIEDIKLSEKAGELGVDDKGKPKPAGLYAQIRFTPRARAFIDGDEIRYLSPEFTLSRLDPRTGKEQGPTLLGAALLNDPFLTELPRVAASDTPMEGTMAIDGKKLRKRLKLAETATEEEVEAALEKEDAPDEKPVQLAELTDTVTKLSAELQASKAEVAKLNAAQRKSEVEAYVAGLVKAGKVQPAIKENIIKMGEAGGLESIKFFENVKPTISLSEQGITGSTESDTNTEVEEASKKFLALADEIHGKGGSYQLAYQAAKSQLPKEYKLHSSRRAAPSKSTRGDA